LKPLSDNISYQDRIKIAKYLSNCDGGSTSDYKSLSKIFLNLDNDNKKKIKSNELKKVVLMITDGGSSNVSLAISEKNKLEECGVIVKAVQIGDPGDGDIDKFRQVWRQNKEDGYSCRDVSSLIPTIERLLSDFLNDL
jgi:Ca2+-binding EF-hand superfamily protein